MQTLGRTAYKGLCEIDLSTSLEMTGGLDKDGVVWQIIIWKRNSRICVRVLRLRRPGNSVRGSVRGKNAWKPTADASEKRRRENDLLHDLLWFGSGPEMPDDLGAEIATQAYVFGVRLSGSVHAMPE